MPCIKDVCMHVLSTIPNAKLSRSKVGRTSDLQRERHVRTRVHEKRRRGPRVPPLRRCVRRGKRLDEATCARCTDRQGEQFGDFLLEYLLEYTTRQGTRNPQGNAAHATCILILSLAIVELVAHQPAHRRVRANEAHHFARYGDSGCATAGHACVLHASSCRNVYSERSAALAEHTTCTCSPVRTPPPQLTEHADHSPAETPGTHSCSFVSSSAGQSAPPCAGAISRVRCRRSMLPPPAKASQPLHALTAQSIAARKRGGQDRRVRRRSRVSR